MPTISQSKDLTDWHIALFLLKAQDGLFTFTVVDTKLF